MGGCLVSVSDRASEIELHDVSFFQDEDDGSADDEFWNEIPSIVDCGVEQGIHSSGRCIGGKEHES